MSTRTSRRINCGLPQDVSVKGRRLRQALPSPQVPRNGGVQSRQRDPLEPSVEFSSTSASIRVTCLLFSNRWSDKCSISSLRNCHARAIHPPSSTQPTRAILSRRNHFLIASPSSNAVLCLYSTCSTFLYRSLCLSQSSHLCSTHLRPTMQPAEGIASRA